MALFASLTARDGNASTPSTSLIPEAIQLHSNLRIDFLNGVAALTLPSSNTTTTTTTTTTITPTAAAAAAANVHGFEVGGIEFSQNTAFSLLSYQAIQTQGRDEEYAPAAANNMNALTVITERQDRRHQDASLRPDLGIWDCRIVNEEENIKSSSSSGTMAATLLRCVVLNNDRFKICRQGSSNSLGDKEEKKNEEAYAAVGHQHGNDGNIQQHTHVPHPPPMVMVIDMSELSEIQQQVERMKEVIVNVFDNGNGNDNLLNNDGISKTHTTSIRALKKCVFGSAAMINDPSYPASSNLAPSEDKRIALILAVILPPSTASTTTPSSTNAADEYKERRARDLVLYHLHKFSMEVDCTLCFVRREGEGGGLMDVSDGPVEGATVANYLPSMSIDDFSKVIRRVALGLSPVEGEYITEIEEANVDNDEATTEDKPSHNIPRRRTPSIYAPGTHDADLINGIYLRNASCDGSWNAVTDDLIVALPPRISCGIRSGSILGEEVSNNTGNGDEEWLSELAHSMGISSDAPDADQPNKETKISTKKRITRASSSSTRDKDAKPKDQKEVLNFFSNLVKK